MITLNQYAHEHITPAQWEDIQMAVRNGSAVFGHKTGDGKSLLAIGCWASWPNIKRVLILGGKSSATTWNKQPPLWADTKVEFITGQAHKRAPIWKEAVTAESGAWFTTYSTFLIHMKEEKYKPHWDLVICDEAHKLRSRKTQLYDQMQNIQFDHMLGLSATWASRGPQDLWAILHLMDRKQFASYWRWVNQYCYIEDTGFGKEIFGVKDVEHLKARLNGKFYISRKGSSPPTTREVIEVDMDPKHHKVYQELDKEMFAVHEDSIVVTPTRLALGTRLHQLAAYPQILFPKLGLGEALEHMVESIEDDPHTVVYTYFTEAIPLIETALRAQGHTNIYTLKGGTAMKDVDAAISGWKSTRGILICSIRFAESFRADTAHTAYVLSFSWDPNENIQAEGRLRARDSLIQTPPLVKYYIVRGTIMEAVKEVTNGKAMTMSQIFSDYAVFRKAQPNGN